MADLDRSLEAERAAAVRTGVALTRLAQVRELRLEVAAGLDAAEMTAVAIRARNELSLAKRVIRDDVELDTERPERSAARAEGGTDLLVRRRANGRRSALATLPSSSRSSPRMSARTSVPSAFTTGIAFEVAAGSISSSSASASIVATPGVSISSGASSRAGNVGARGIPALSRCPRRSRRSRSGRACSRPTPPARGSHARRRRPSPRSPPGRRTPRARNVRRCGGTPARGGRSSVEPRLVAVERVRVLHDELADAEQPVARPGLVALLRLEVVEHLRQLPVRLQLRRVERERLLVTHRQDERAPAGVLQVEEDRNLDPARALPQLGRGQHRSEHLLRPEAPSSSRMTARSSGGRASRAAGTSRARDHLSDEPAANEQLVRRGLGVAGRLAQGRQEQL